MNRPARWLALIAALLCCSCAKALPESNIERQAILNALESRLRLDGAQEVRDARVKSSSNSAVVKCVVYYGQEVQISSIPYKAKLVKTDGKWVVKSSKADWPPLTQILGVK
jgi:hypothetical protein